MSDRIYDKLNAIDFQVFPNNVGRITITQSYDDPPAYQEDHLVSIDPLAIGHLIAMLNDAAEELIAIERTATGTDATPRATQGATK